MDVDEGIVLDDEMEVEEGNVVEIADDVDVVETTELETEVVEAPEVVELEVTVALDVTLLTELETDVVELEVAVVTLLVEDAINVVEVNEEAKLVVDTDEVEETKLVVDTDDVVATVLPPPVETDPLEEPPAVPLESIVVAAEVLDTDAVMDPIDSSEVMVPAELE
ncbi:hypothetical protein MMC34_001688 [Xylographa carneopallida]|nr:hypothetical protein [Xylographa carneopallida]